MWRAFFIAISIAVVILGLECMVLDHAILRPPRFAEDSVESYLTDRKVQLPDWAPWTLISGGAVMLLYSVSLKPGGGG